MRLIHANEFCRDIAIWYDEFLTPGESFNDEIASALEKSRLFALAVTPNLINEQNYVMRVEYPMAKKSGTPILPAVLVKTSGKGLQKGFEGIPDTVDAYDGAALSEALMQRLGELAIRENDNSPQHNFFIGLAYLSGIDVEVDHERAVRLITSSAEAGLPEAVGKLVNMYRDGEGVERDLEASIQWQKRLVEIKKAEAEAGDAEAVKGYLTELNDMAYRVYRISRIDESIEVYRALESEAERLADKTGEGTALSFELLANKWIGTMQYSEGRTAEAVENLTKAVVFGKRYAELSELGKGHLADCYSALGHAYKSVSRFVDAEEQYRLAFAIRRELVRTASTANNQKSLAISYDDIGFIEVQLGNTAKGIEYYTEALRIFEAVAMALPSVSNQNSLAICLDRLADAYAVSDRVKAREYYASACTAFSEVAEKTGSYSDICSLAAEYATIGNNEDCIGDPEGARGYYLHAIELYERISDKDITVTASHNRAAAYSRYGDLCRRLGELENAEKYLLLSLKIREGLDGESGVSQVRRGKGTVYARLGLLYKQKNLLKESEKYYLEALGIYEAGVRDGDRKAEIGAGQVKRSLASIYKEEGEIDKAMRLMEEWVVTAENDAVRRGSLDAKRNYASAKESYAILLFDTMRESAVEKYAQALEIYDEIARESVSGSDAGDVLRLSAWLGGEYERQGATDKAIREYERANAARYEKDGSYYTLEGDAERAKRCVSLGKLYLKQGESEKAAAALYEAIELFGCCDGCAAELCDSKGAYADACAALGETETAAEWYDEAIREYSFICLRTLDAGYYYYIAELYRRKAGLYDVKKRKKWLKKGYGIAKMLAKKFPDTAEYTELLREISAELGKR
ncbi:MAG: SEL1-like repeat protein [Clostridia bacterium]|nr:SEL1-like repeat protein [Clostridia bacterium]